MYLHKKIYIWICSIFIFVPLWAQSLYNGVGHIPCSHQLNWYNAGLLKDCNSITPKLVIDVSSFSGTDDEKVAASLNNARSHVNDTEGMAIVYFPEGDYLLFDTIELDFPDSNIVFQGDGSDKTILNFQNLAGNSDYRCFELSGSGWSNPVTIVGDISKTDSEIVVDELTGLSDTSWVHFYKPVYDYDTPNPPLDENIVGQVSQIININGSTITIKDEANMPYYVSSPNYSILEMRSFNPIRNIGIENLTIKRDENEPHADCGDYNVSFNSAVNCWIRGVESSYAARNHLNINRSSHIEISGCFFHKAGNYGGGGNGYGVVLYASTTNCLIENNILRKLRHAMVAGGGSNCNVWAFNYSREQYSTKYGIPYDDRDMDLHAKYPFGHLFEQNMIERVEADDYHGKNGPYNAFVRNYVTTNDAVDLKRMDDWSTIGNIGHINLLYAPLHEWDNNPTRDLFGMKDNYTVAYNHNSVAYYPSDGEDCRLLDISYYYSERPYFLTDDYTWPALGAKISSGDLNQSIPAKARWNTLKKTYIKYPTSQSLTTSGTLSSDEIWSGSIACTGDVTVPSGITLTIVPGADITFPDGNTLQIEGTLEAIGTSSEPISFDCSDPSNTWYGIQFENGSSGHVEYCTIHDASYGVRVDHSSPVVKNCTFLNNNYALYIYYGMDSNEQISNNTMDGSHLAGIALQHPVCPWITNCTIENGTYYGIRASYADDGTWFHTNNIRNNGREGVRLYQSNPIFIDNNIYWNDEEGMYIYGNSDPFLEDDISGGDANNVVAYNNEKGIYVRSGCVPVLGYYHNDWEKANSFYNNGNCDLYSESDNCIYARYNYWGFDNGDTTLFRIYGNMKCKPAVYMDPNPDPRNLSKKSLDGEQTEESFTVQAASPDSNALALFEKAFALQIDKKYEQAIILYKQIIENYAFTSAAEMAVVRMARCYKKLDQKPNGKAELSQIAQLHRTDNLGLAASEIAGNWAIEAGHVDEGISYYQRIVQSKTSRSRQALFELWSVYFHMTENKGLQSSLIKQYENDYGVDENLINMKLTMGLISGKEAKEWAIEQIEKDKGLGKKMAREQKVPDVFALRHNYPNPFNPVTRIDYDIPKDVHVKMEIYNVLGQKIVVLVDRDTEAGSYTELWNATNSHGQKVGAGLYFCRITTGTFRKTIKMTLLP